MSEPSSGMLPGYSKYNGNVIIMLAPLCIRQRLMLNDLSLCKTSEAEIPLTCTGVASNAEFINGHKCSE